MLRSVAVMLRNRIGWSFISRNLKLRAIWALILLQILLFFIFAKVSNLWPGSAKFKLRYDSKLGKEFLGLNISESSIQNRTYHSIEESNFWKQLRSNPVYQSFQIKPVKIKQKITLLIIVSSAPKRFDRRQAIRQTWWGLCKDTTKYKNKVTVKCIFMTDKQKKGSDMFAKIEQERKKYNDIELQSLQGGVEFGRRYMYHLHWAMENYDFDYFLRMDDDYFLCLDKLISELLMPPVKYFHWGWAHCLPKITRPEESIIMFSRSIVQLFLSQSPEKTYCHPWADQLIATWVDQLQLPMVYHTDTRLHHDPPAEGLKQFKNLTNVCMKYIGVHGSYPATMRNLWKNRGTYSIYDNHTLLAHSKQCKVESKFDWTKFVDNWKYEPQLCIKNPVWDTKKQGTAGALYQGRQQEKLGVTT